jgi:hypothetical protein
MILLMLNSVALMSQDINAGLWRRYLDLLLESIRARNDQRPLSEPALGNDQLENATKDWVRLRR